MKLGEAISKAEGLMTIGCLFDVTENGGRIQAAFDAYRTYEEDGEQKTQHGDGSFTILHNSHRGFEPSMARFSARDGDTTTELDWRWDGDKFVLIEENGHPVKPVLTVERLSRS